MSVREHRRQLLELMEENSIAVVYSGRPTPENEDEYLPFRVNSQFFYLTGLQRAGMVLLLGKYGGIEREELFIEPVDDFLERWTGRMPRPEEVRKQAELEDVSYTTDFSGTISSILGRYVVDTAYFDLYRVDREDLPSWNAVKAAEFRNSYPAVCIRDLHRLTAVLRQVKDAEEVEAVRQAIAITHKGLDALLSRLQPGMKEYQAQAVFEGTCHYEGAKNLAFPTIAAGGKNACSMHYDENSAVLQDGSLLLLDLGAKYGNYCSDISRTYPVSGTYSPRQRELYELVLRANHAVAETAAPGVTFGELESLTCEILGDGLVELGLLEDAADVRKYYMHSVSHSIGIDCHDANLRGMEETVLQPGWIISDEPGLYIDEEGIGIRIEDDLLITEDGCEVLSEAIPRDPDVIEAIMAEAGEKRTGAQK